MGVVCGRRVRLQSEGPIYEPYVFHDIAKLWGTCIRN